MGDSVPTMRPPAPMPLLARKLDLQVQLRTATVNRARLLNEYERVMVEIEATESGEENKR